MLAPVAATSPTASAASSSGTIAPQSASPSTGPTATPIAEASAPPSPEPSENPNLLTFAHGTFIRSWTVGASTSAPEDLAVGTPWATDGPFRGTPELVFELPAVAQLSQITVAAILPAGQSANLHLAAATSEGHFADAGSIALASQGSGEVIGALSTPISARWLRVQIERSPGASVRIDSIVAVGTVDVPAQKLAGRWEAGDVPGYAEAVFDRFKGAVPAHAPTNGVAIDQVATGERAGELTAATCTYERDVWRGPVRGGAAALDGGGSLNVVADGSLLVGVASGVPILARRIAHAPGCDASPAGNGAPVAILARYLTRADDVGNPKLIPGHRFQTTLLPLFQAGDLKGMTAAVLALSCAVDKDTTAQQQGSLDRKSVV